MGADIYIFTEYDPEFPESAKEFVEKHENYYYFRDSYNWSNLAWIKDLSYWRDFVEDPLEFLQELASITDEEIEKYVNKTFKDESDKEKESWIRYFKGKRDYIKALVDAEIIDIDYSV